MFCSFTRQNMLRFALEVDLAICKAPCPCFLGWSLWFCELPGGTPVAPPLPSFPTSLTSGHEGPRGARKTPFRLLPSEVLNYWSHLGPVQLLEASGDSSERAEKEWNSFDSLLQKERLASSGLKPGVPNKPQACPETLTFGADQTEGKAGSWGQGH